MELFLGIDLGTTTVKIALIDGKTKRVFIERDRAHGQEKGEGSRKHEQCPIRILGTLRELLDEIDPGKLDNKLLKGIAVSGQMHGVMMWKAAELRYPREQCKCSKLITWMDARCDQQFLAKLPRWNDGEMEKRIATGYGMATLAWLKEHGELGEEDGGWDRAGTVMDFLVSYLTQHQGMFISTQNAESWGYASGLSWTNRDYFDLFPTHLFPTIVPPNTILGSTSIPFSNLPLGIPVLVGLGDLQTSFLPILKKGEAALQIGTASQLVFICNQSNNLWHQPNPAIRRDPYFDGDHLLVAASLNGGNVFHCLFRQISAWSSTLFGSTTEMDNSHISSLLARILDAPSPVPDPDSPPLIVHPTFYGERHTPLEKGANVQRWCPDTSFEELIHSMARGIIANLAQMMPVELLRAHSICRLRMVGRANQRAFVEEAKRQFPGMEILRDEQGMSAAVGAALWAQKKLGNLKNDGFIR